MRCRASETGWPLGLPVCLGWDGERPVMSSEFVSAPAEPELLPQNLNGDVRFTFEDKGLELTSKAEVEKYTVRGHLGRHSLNPCM